MKTYKIRTRCPNGTRKNKITNKCEDKTKSGIILLTDNSKIGEHLKNNKKSYLKLSNENKKKFINDLHSLHNNALPKLKYNHQDVMFSFLNLKKRQNYETSFPGTKEFYQSLTINKLGSLKQFLRTSDNHTDNFVKVDKFMKDFEVTIIDKDENINWYLINNLSYFYNGNELTKCTVKYYKNPQKYFRENYYKIYDEYFSNLSFYYENGYNISPIDFNSSPNENTLNIRLLYEVLAKKNKLCTIFKPNIFKLLITIFKPSKTKPIILDLSSGWGDRLIASIAMESKIQQYVGIDPNQYLFKGYSNMIKDFATDPNKFQMLNLPAENVTPIKLNKLCKTNTFNPHIVFWSPPFSDQEDYVTNSNRDDFYNQSTNKFKTYEKWENDFLIKTLDNTANIISQNGVMILYLGNINYTSFFEKMKQIQTLKYIGVLNIKLVKIRKFHIFLKL
jgi:hypothetical protein